jgi:hypothetical protein
VCEREIATS